jgi:hypothetical protein
LDANSMRCGFGEVGQRLLTLSSVPKVNPWLAALAREEEEEKEKEEKEEKEENTTRFSHAATKEKVVRTVCEGGGKRCEREDRGKQWEKERQGHEQRIMSRPCKLTAGPWWSRRSHPTWQLAGLPIPTPTHCHRGAWMPVFSP